MKKTEILNTRQAKLNCKCLKDSKNKVFNTFFKMKFGPCANNVCNYIKEKKG